MPSLSRKIAEALIDSEWVGELSDDAFDNLADLIERDGVGNLERDCRVLQRQLDAVDNHLPPWKGNDCGRIEMIERMKAERDALARRVRELEETLSEVVDDTVLIDGFPAMRGTPSLPQYLAEQRERREQWEQQAEGRVKDLMGQLATVQHAAFDLQQRIEEAVELCDTDCWPINSGSLVKQLVRILRGDTQVPEGEESA